MSDMTAKTEPLNDRQKRALPYLAASQNIQEGCRQAKITTDTYYRWIKKTAFSDALKKQQDGLVSDAMATLKANIGKAVDVLVSLLGNENNFLKRQIANDIIGHVIRFRELSELEERLESVEKIVMEKRTYR